MSDIGPELPPHLLAKRKRQQEEEAKDESAANSGAKDQPSPPPGEKRRRIIGPAMPPAPLDERPETPLKEREESDSDDDDGFGPSLPANDTEEAGTDKASDRTENTATQAEPAPTKEKLQRDEWMTMAPKQDDLATRMDPTKQRPRAFNTSKGARGPNVGGEDDSSWHETLEEKQKRLADEMMGVSKPSKLGPQVPSQGTSTSKDAAASRKIREHTEKARGPSLMEKHQTSANREPDDDPTQRAFDREKDMSSGMRIGHAQRRDLVNKASNFSSKFSGGSYL